MESYNKNDFRIEWYSGQGAGGQHRNKHQNCCRIIHIPTGLKAQGTESRERSANQRRAFERLVSLIRSKSAVQKERRTDNTVIRNYHAVRNEVYDKASGLKMPYRDIVEGRNIGPMIEARLKAQSESP